MGMTITNNGVVAGPPRQSQYQGYDNPTDIDKELLTAEVQGLCERMAALEARLDALEQGNRFPLNPFTPAEEEGQ